LKEKQAVYIVSVIRSRDYKNIDKLTTYILNNEVIITNKNI
jgi:hypothetical protein